MKRRVARTADRQGSGPGIPLARFTQPTRLIIQRLLLEGRAVEVEAELLRVMLDEPMTSVRGVTSEQSARAREEIRRAMGATSERAVSLEAFSDPTQRVILLVAADRGGSGFAPESVSSADLERFLDRDLTLLPGVGGGKAMRARREIRDVLQEVLGRQIPVASPPRSPKTSPATADLLRGAEGSLRLTIKIFDILEHETDDLARHLRRAGNGPADEATRASERSAVESLREGVAEARVSLDRCTRLFREFLLETASGSGRVSHRLEGVAIVLSDSSRRLDDLDWIMSHVGAELGVRGEGWGRGDAVHAAFLLTEGPQSFIGRLREVRSDLLDPAERLHELVREESQAQTWTPPLEMHGLHPTEFAAGHAGRLAERLDEPFQEKPRAQPPVSADELLIGSPVFAGTVIRGGNWTSLVEGQGLDTSEFVARHARKLRDLEMARRRRAGESLAAIGKAHGMTRERVRQIIRDVAVSLPAELRDEVLDAGRARRRADEQSLRGRLLEEVISAPRPELAAIAGRLGVEPERAWEALGPLARKFVRRTVARDHDWQARQWSDEAMKEALLEASLYVAPFSGAGYDEALAEGLVEGPSRGSIINRFGTWNDACIAAGISPNPKRREEYERRWSDDELIGHVVRFIVSDAPTTSHAAYESWRLGRLAEGQDVPSTSLIRIRLGGWAAAVEQAWGRVVEQGWLARRPEVIERLRAEAGAE